MLIDDLFASSGSMLIVITWNQKAMEHCAIEICKVNIKELDEETYIRLLITYTYK